MKLRLTLLAKFVSKWLSNSYLIYIAVFFYGCSTASHTNNKEITVVGVETVSEQALKEIQSTSTTFTLPISESIVAWDRARMFFLQYQGVTSIKSIESQPTHNQTLLSNEAISNAKYLYQIVRKPIDGGTLISVKCTPRFGRGSNNNAIRNAKNLSRFIREGTLEISFLDR